MKRSTKIATVLAIAGLVLGNIAGANAANKTITCYKGTTVKKVTAAKPKCPTGFSTTKPKAAASTPATSKGGTVKINATYKGTVTMLWGDADVNVTNVTATGTGETGGLDKLTGMGSAAPAEQCTPFDGEGTLGSGADTLKVKYADGSMACSADADAPTTVTIKKGPLTIVSGTGKYAGATGSLTLTGSWAIASASKGSKPATPVTLTLTGTITTK
ncbi:MAG: hypothetical protein ACR2H8_00485 [Candidatus Nanopelagicaceae bacterium]